MPRGANLRLRNAAIKQVLANTRCGNIFARNYQYAPAPPRVRMTLEEKAMRAQARMDARRAARADPDAVLARKERARVARLAAKTRKAMAAANAAADAIRGVPRAPRADAARRAPRARAPRVDPGAAQRQADADFLRGERELAEMLAEITRGRAAQPQRAAQRLEFTMDDIMRRVRR